jgi:DNA-binding CsgD family transcriptional regulator
MLRRVDQPVRQMPSRVMPANDFVGRARELALLNAALTADREGRAPIVVVDGEPGIGKTRTVAEFAAGARAAGSVVLWGTCHQGGVTAPYDPWVQAIAEYADGVEPERVTRLAEGDVAVLAQFVPAIARMVPDVRVPPTLPPDQSRIRLYEAVVRFLDAIDEPAALVLDDLHWADADTLELLVHVARFAARTSIVVLYRSAELAIADPVAHRLAEIDRHRKTEFLLLGSLPLDEAGVLLAKVADVEVRPELLDAIYAESGGNPFFLCELGRHLHRYGDPTAAGWRPPETVRQAVGLRLAGLSAHARRMLELAAVFSAGFSFGDLAALTELDDDTLLDCLDEALAAEVLRALGAERYDFAHALVRHALYDDFSASRRVRLHRRVAEVLEESHAGRLEDVAAELARQYHASATLPGAERGVVHALTAAERAQAASAPAEAAAFRRLALDLTPRTDVAARAARTGELALAQAEAAMLEDAPRALEAALGLFAASDAPAEVVADVVYRVVSVLQDGLANQATLEPLIARGLAALGENRGLAWARLKLLERPCELVPAGSVHVARWLGFDRDAVRIARAEGSEADHARTIDQFARWSLADLEEILERVASWQDPVARLRGLVVLTWNATVTRWSGSTVPAEQLCADIDRLGEELGSLPARAMAAMFHAAVLGARGDLAASAEDLARAKPLIDRLPPGHRVPIVGILISELTAQHIDPDWPRMARLMCEIAERRDQIPWFGLAWAGVGAHAFARAGMGDEARRLLADIVPGMSAADPWDYAQNCSVSYAAEAVWDLRATEFAEPLLAAARALIAAGAGDYYMASNELTAARLCGVLGRSDEALAYFASARSVLQARGQRPLLAIVDHDEGIVLRAMKRGDAERRLRAARRQFAALGMTDWSRRVALLEPSDGAADGLTRREAEILRLVAAGRTNREIASDLVTSVQAVERHLASAYRKISVRNPSDATADESAARPSPGLDPAPG